MKDVLSILKDTGLYKARNHNKTHNIYNFDNGSYIEFFSAQEEERLRGRKRRILYYDEATECSWDAWVQLSIRTEKKIIVSYNPSLNNSFLYKLPPEECVKIHSTWRDNPFLGKEQIKQILDLKRTDYDSYLVFSEGIRANTKENVYTKWKVVEKPENIDFEICYGIDFGYTHPTAMVKLYYNIELKMIWLEEVIYEKGLTSTDLIDRMREKGVDPSIMILADGARPEIIMDIRRAGFRVMNATKDVLQGILHVKSFEILVDPNANNIITENESYKWKKIKGEIQDEVLKEWDDCMDSLRYAVYYIKQYGMSDGCKAY
jgi:phage terminase large subunit